MSSTRRPVAVVLLLPAALFLVQCQENAATPPAPKAQAKAASSECCQIAPANGLKEGMGRVATSFPPVAGSREARVEVHTPGGAKPIAVTHGSNALELAPGTYEVTISGKRIAGVPVQGGHETRIKVGVLHINATNPQTRIDLIDPTTQSALISGYGERSYGLPIGPVGVQVAGQTETVTIEDGKVTEF